VDSTEQNPSHDFDAEGTYTVSLTVTSASGSDSEIKANLVTIGISTRNDWSQWQNGVTHYAVHESDDPVLTADLRWSYDAGGSNHDLDVTPLIVGDVVYIFDATGQVHAVSRSSGAMIWTSTIDESSYFQSSVPAYGDGKLFVATFGGHLYAFDATTGERLWKVKATTGSSRNFECPVTYYDHKIYIGEGLSGGVATKYYYCYDDQGHQIWKYAVENTAGFLWAGAVVVGDNLVLPVFNGMLISIDRTTGELTDEIDLRDSSRLSFAQPDLGMIRSSVTYAGGFIYVTSEKGQAIGYIFKIAFSNGQFHDDGWGTAIGFSTSTPVVYGGRVYVGNGEHGATSGNLTCLNDEDGSIIWAFNVDSGVKSSPAIFVDGDQEYIYFAVERGVDGSVYCVNRDGVLIWEFDPEGDDAYILQGVALSGDAVFFGTDDGMLYCLGGSEGD
jgi:outer membrane protein assembly factor BamB